MHTKLAMMMVNLLAVVSIADVVGRANDGVAVVAASRIQACLSTSAHVRCDTFVDILTSK